MVEVDAPGASLEDLEVRRGQVEARVRAEGRPLPLVGAVAAVAQAVVHARGEDLRRLVRQVRARVQRVWARPGGRLIAA